MWPDKQYGRHTPTPTAVSGAIAALKVLLVCISRGCERRRRHGATEQHRGRHRQPRRAGGTACFGHLARAGGRGEGYRGDCLTAGVAMLFASLSIETSNTPGLMPKPSCSHRGAVQLQRGPVYSNNRPAGQNDLSKLEPSQNLRLVPLPPTACTDSQRASGFAKAGSKL